MGHIISRAELSQIMYLGEIADPMLRSLVQSSDGARSELKQGETIGDNHLSEPHTSFIFEHFQVLEQARVSSLRVL